MHICTEPMLETDFESEGQLPETGRLGELRLRFEELRDSVDSEWSAVSQALVGPGRDPMRKWLGWALYRVATRVNPEINDS